VYEVVDAYLVNHTPLHFDWKTIGYTSLMAGVAYLGKNFVTKQRTFIVAPKEDVQISQTSSGAVTVRADAPAPTPEMKAN
jgi:hypothetical protein